MRGVYTLSIKRFLIFLLFVIFLSVVVFVSFMTIRRSLVLVTFNSSAK